MMKEDVLQKLLDQSMEEVEEMGVVVKFFDYQKFAKLIINECADVAADHDALDIYEEIREHFGV